MVAHARQLGANDERERAVELLEKLPWTKKRPQPEWVPSARSEQLSQLTELGRLDEALALADGTTAPAAEPPLAYALIQAKRFADATAVLDKACPTW